MKDQDLITAHIAANGVTRCPVAAVAPTTGVISGEDARALARWARRRRRRGEALPDPGTFYPEPDGVLDVGGLE